MREIDASMITQTVKELCIGANYHLNQDIRNRFKEAEESETFPIAKNIIEILSKNADIADSENMPMCQDTGMAVVFVDIGQDVHVTGGNLGEAINEGVKQGYIEGFLRKSVVSDPFERKNTGDNTPAIIHYNIVSGDRINLSVAPKGFGSENMSQIKMLKPSDGVSGVKDFILKVVKDAGPNPCPPMVVGVGIGGNFEMSALLAKKALLRSTDIRNSNSYYAELERELLDKVNSLGIGPQGFGGRTTALAVNIEVFATHIAGLPVAVNINCHATRHMEAVL